MKFWQFWEIFRLFGPFLGVFRGFFAGFLPFLKFVTLGVQSYSIDLGLYHISNLFLLGLGWVGSFGPGFMLVSHIFTLVE